MSQTVSYVIGLRIGQKPFRDENLHTSTEITFLNGKYYATALTFVPVSIDIQKARYRTLPLH